MGTLNIPNSNLVYVDTSPVIYSVEKFPEYLPLLSPLWLKLFFLYLTQKEWGISPNFICVELVKIAENIHIGKINYLFSTLTENI